jgi:molybdopterin-guanine dinucleotide biosynthesis protein A
MLSKETISKSAYPSPLDAIVLAGTDSNPKRMIQGRNKAFLEIGGQVLVRRVVEALVHASSIGQVYVVGPGAPLRQVLEGLPPSYLPAFFQPGRQYCPAPALLPALAALEPPDPRRKPAR